MIIMSVASQIPTQPRIESIMSKKQMRSSHKSAQRDFANAVGIGHFSDRTGRKCFDLVEIFESYSYPKTGPRHRI